MQRLWLELLTTILVAFAMMTIIAPSCVPKICNSGVASGTDSAPDTWKAEKLVYHLREESGQIYGDLQGCAL
jgi:hypothetical protein